MLGRKPDQAVNVSQRPSAGGRFDGVPFQVNLRSEYGALPQDSRAQSRFGLQLRQLDRRSEDPATTQCHRRQPRSRGRFGCAQRSGKHGSQDFSGRRAACLQACRPFSRLIRSAKWRCYLLNLLACDGGESVRETTAVPASLVPPAPECHPCLICRMRGPRRRLSRIVLTSPPRCLPATIVKPPLSPDIMRDRRNLLAPDTSSHSNTPSSTGAH